MTLRVTIQSLRSGRAQEPLVRHAMTALHVSGSGAADPSRFAKTAAPLERSKRNAKREERPEHFEERRQKREERLEKREMPERSEKEEKQREQRGSGKVGKN